MGPEANRRICPPQKSGLTLVLILLQRKQRLDLIPQVFPQHRHERLDDALQPLAAVRLPAALDGINITHKRRQAVVEGLVLPHVGLHDAPGAGEALDLREEERLLGLVVLVDAEPPLLGVVDKVRDGPGGLGLHVDALQVHAVDAAEQHVVHQAHLLCDDVGALELLARLDEWVRQKEEQKSAGSPPVRWV
ncbi:hypothetical protein VP1G_10587 [Cytospora mali]|uniref:Uncharacterized protein n=1 Tax=Cytospora mali TaxID=578113 RepID=A0A194UPT7_CYTMA|nr:hypothetical protein VP1G_10587 [Valsa mali var. pyri (nom. inval.)]